MKADIYYYDYDFIREVENYLTELNISSSDLLSTGVKLDEEEMFYDFSKEECKNFDIKIYESEELKLMKEFIEKCRREWEIEWEQGQGKRSYIWKDI